MDVEPSIIPYFDCKKHFHGQLAKEDIVDRANTADNVARKEMS